MNKAFKQQGKAKWKSTRYYRLLQNRLAIGMALASQVCAQNYAHMQQIRLSKADNEYELALKEMAILNAVVKNQSMVMDAMYWWRK